MTQPKPPIIGPPLDLTPEMLDQAAVLTPVDVALARSAWIQSVPPKLVDLLDAVPDQPNA
jgi:hypothetical protein